MAADTCKSCGQGTVNMDSVYGILACDNCGRVFDDEATFLGAHNQQGHVMERGGTLVRHGETGAMAACGLGGSLLHNGNRDDINRRDVMNKMKEITAILQVPMDKVEDVKFMLERLLEGEWGQGRWIEVLVGACTYVAIRQSNLPLTLVEVASSVDCGIAELGRMYRRVIESLELTMPEPDAVVFLERAVASLAQSKGIDRNLSRKMSKQGGLLLECSHQWFIITGRHPLPVVAAVIALVAEANQVQLNFDDVVAEVYSHPRTSRMRLKELKEALVGAGQKLPWRKDITVKTLDKYLPFILEYLERRMNREKKKKCNVAEMPSIRSPSKVYEEQSTSTSGEGLEDCGSMEFKLVEALRRKEVEWQAWPKSFRASADAYSRRCDKIIAATERIQKAKQGLSKRMSKDEPGVESSRVKRQKVETKCELDWEDLVIEYLLLRGVSWLILSILIVFAHDCSITYLFVCHRLTALSWKMDITKLLLVISLCKAQPRLTMTRSFLIFAARLR